MTEQKWTKQQDERTKMVKTTGERAQMVRTTEGHKKDGHLKLEAKTNVQKKGRLIQN
jgi:hypothetical protein